MNALLNAIQQETNKTTTTNGMKAFTSTLDDCVDLFFKIGASRGKDIIPQFAKAFAANEDYALRIALWARDIRGGAGERQLFRDILKYLAQNHYESCLRVMSSVTEVGRFDDLLELVDTPAESDAFIHIKVALQAGNGLCAKWMPRKGRVAEKLRAFLAYTPKQYRKTLVNLTKVVESQMCANQWTEIEYSKIPSLASARYQKAFGRHDPEGYNRYISQLQSGEVKINAGAVYPYDVVKSLNNGNASVANAQWVALKDYVGEHNFLPVVDVSDSMARSAGGNNKLSCMDVAISLGLYLSERNKSAFKDAFVTFSSEPKLQLLKGTLQDRYYQLQRAEWGMSTDFEKVFDLVLRAAVKYNLKQEELPEYIVVLSDMQFNKAGRGKAAFGTVKQKYKDAGYDMPVLVFWNLNANDNVPVKADKEGTVLVSGFSPSLMQSLLSGKTVTPLDQMLEIIMNPRYNV